MRVGVVQAIVRPPWSFQNPTKVVRGRRARKRPDEQTTFVQSEAKRKTGPLRVRLVCRRGGRQSPSRGEQLTALRLQSGRMGNRLPPVKAVCRGDSLTQR